MAIISTEAVAAPADAVAGATVTVTDTVDPGLAETDGGAPLDMSDLDILAEVEAAQGITPTVVGEEAAVEGEQPKPEEESESVAIAGETAEVKKARAILASANKKLARANATRAQVAAAVRAEIVAGLKTKPNAMFRELGTSIGEILDAESAAGDEPAKPPATEDRVTALERERDEARAAVARNAADAQVAQLTGAIHADIKASKDFPRINAANKGQGAHALVTDLMIEYHADPANKGARLPAAEAAKIVEEFLGELAGGTPIPAPKSPAPPQRTAPPQRQGSQTLANNEIRNVGPGPDDLPMDLDARTEAVFREMGLRRN